MWQLLVILVRLVDQGSKINRTLNSLHHRGPDSNGYYYTNDNLSNNLYLLHTRLNVIDIDQRSNQPYRIGAFTLIFNGEIYNYLEIKNLLLAEGIIFETTGDTEVLARALIKWGIDKTLDKLEECGLLHSTIKILVTCIYEEIVLVKNHCIM